MDSSLNLLPCPVSQPVLVDTTLMLPRVPVLSVMEHALLATEQAILAA